MVEKVWEGDEEGEARRQTNGGKVNIHGCSWCVVLQLVMNDGELSAGGAANGTVPQQPRAPPAPHASSPFFSLNAGLF